MKNPDRIWAQVRKRENLSRLARILRISRQAVHKWDRVPSQHLARVAEVLERRPEDLRPDLFDPFWSLNHP